MPTPDLRSIFASVAYKELVAVDLPGGSHQHEINGDTQLRQFFSSEEQRSGPINWHYFADNTDPISETGSFYFYDSRLKSAARTGRSEWRLYYSGEFLSNASPGDTLILLRTPDNTIHGMAFQADSGWLRTVRVLLDLPGNIQRRLITLSDENLAASELEYSRQQILEELGFEISLPVSPGDEELAVLELENARSQGLTFPSTQRMAELAWGLEVDIANGDDALVRWLSREEEIFRAIEKIVVQEKLDENFATVDDFLSYSLTVQNRRKSRMGFSLENHLSRLFTGRGLRFESQKTTEGKRRPDFLFPGQTEYQNPSFKSRNLVMLAAKSTCKDRWRQILNEAERIPEKHLCTLERSISTAQTNEMREESVTLILPAKYHDTYTQAQRAQIWTVNEFIDFVRQKQAG